MEYLHNVKIIVDIDIYFNGKYPEKYIALKFEKMGYKVKRCLRIGNGHPDLICEKGLKKLFIEVKKDSNSLMISQANWFSKNKDKIIILYFLLRSKYLR